MDKKIATENTAIIKYASALVEKVRDKKMSEHEAKSDIRRKFALSDDELGKIYSQALLFTR